MPLDDELERLELALDDHYGSVENLESALEETEDAQQALRHLVDIVNIQDTQMYSTEQVVFGVTQYLLDHRQQMDTRAVQLKNNQEELEDVLEKYNGSSNGGVSRRGFLLGAGVATAGAVGLGAGYAVMNGDGGQEEPEYVVGGRYTLGDPDNFESVISDDSQFYDWIEDVDYEIGDLGVKLNMKNNGANGILKELEDYDEDNNTAILGESVGAHLEPHDVNQKRIGQ